MTLRDGFRAAWGELKRTWSLPARCAVSDGERAFLFSDLHLILGDERTRERRAEKVRCLVLGTGADGRPHIIVFRNSLRRSGTQLGSAVARAFFVRALASQSPWPRIGRKGDHFDVMGFLGHGNDDEVSGPPL